MPFALLNMAAFHTFVELFAVCIAVMSFVVTWHTFSFSRSHFILFLGCGYFWVGVIDLFHALTFKNIISFEGSYPGTTVEFWIIARIFEAFTLLLAPLTLKSAFNPLRLFFTIGALSFAAILAVFAKLIPDMYIAGTGLTNIKVYSEYGIIAVLLLAAVALSLKRQKIEPSTLTLLLLSIALTIMAELSFTLYSGLNDVPIIIGHFFKLFSFWAIYCALVESSVTRPFYSLYQLVHSYDSISESTVIVDEQGIIQHANTAIRDAKGSDIIGEHCHQFLHPSAISIKDCPICRAIKNTSTLNAF